MSLEPENTVHPPTTKSDDDQKLPKVKGHLSREVVFAVVAAYVLLALMVIFVFALIFIKS